MKKINIEINEIETMIFVATLPRSGSSMDCGILESCGAFGGNTIGCVPNNPKGIFENRGINSMLLKPIFDEMGVRSPRGLLTIHKSGGPPKDLFDNFERDLTYAMNRQGYNGGPAYFKNGIYTFMFNRINEIFPEAIWILPKRNINSVFVSTKRIHPDKPEDKIKQDIDDYRLMYDHIKNVAGERAFEVDNDEVLTGNFSTIRDAVEFAGMVWNNEAVQGWVDPALWGNVKYQAEDMEAEEKKEARSGGNNGG